MEQFDYAEYEETLKNQPLYKNQFNLAPGEKEKYLQMVPQWVNKWQQELDKVYGG